MTHYENVQTRACPICENDQAVEIIQKLRLQGHGYKRIALIAKAALQAIGAPHGKMAVWEHCQHTPRTDSAVYGIGDAEDNAERLVSDNWLKQHGIDVDAIQAAGMKMRAATVEQRSGDGDSPERHWVRVAPESGEEEPTEPDWPVVQQAAPCIVNYSPRSGVGSAALVTVLLPDPQIGFRRLDNGTMIPMHDEVAIACMLELLSVIRPHRIINLGDTLDLPEWSSKFLVLPEFVLTTQPTVDYAHHYLAEQCSAAGPQCTEIDLLEGNHDERMARWIAKNAMAALRLRQANSPQSWPVMSVPHLLRLDELSITYHSGYPAGRVKVANAHGSQAPLYALHGEKLSMERQAKAERISTVQGHAHHFSMHSETYDLGDGCVEVEAHSLGCLCRRTGEVPSTRGGTDLRGTPIPRTESWQHGIGVVVEDEDSWDLTHIRIHEGRARWGETVVSAPQAIL